MRRICWEKLPKGWLKLNTDGSVEGGNGLACCGGVIRDAVGQWVRGFSRRIGTTNAFAAELWGLREGLMLCRSLNLSALVIELDAESIVNVLNNPSYANSFISPILDDCKVLISHMPQIQIKHCFRQANHCADRLARKSFSQIPEFSLFDSQPMDMIDVYEDDLNGMYFDRICPDPCISF
ncbi:hypothetical protein SO802_027875 [Lithocarpus litseifolius]|uniref:RNase H type-1 domain-containing protein n=1 Tax=Lithocarpus litseifolius TaxID=425828 RepID=A0AAW2BNY3_9ROSI